MIDPKALNTIIARLKIHEASLQKATLSESQRGIETSAHIDHTELQKAIAELEAAQSQIIPGSLVKQKVTGEIGRVVAIFNPEGFDDTYVAFFGKEAPNASQRPNPRPYVLRYCLSSLELLTENESSAG